MIIDDFENIVLAKDIIEKDITRHFSIAELAHRVGMGETKLKTGFKEIFGIPIYTYLQNARMSQAQELVLYTSKSIKQITQLCGFKHSPNFVHAYVKFYGITPAKDRRNFIRKPTH